MRALFAALSMLAPLAIAAQAQAQTQAHAVSLPPRIAADKVVHVAVNGTYPPMESIDPATNKLVGFDIDLGEAIAKKLGVTLEWQDGTFAQLIPAVQTGRADMILSGISDLPARRETLDFIDYLNSGAQFYTLEASAGIKTPEDLCGKKVGTVRSTSFMGNIADWSAAHCTGKAPIEAVGVDRMPLVAIELQQGRIDAAVRGSETIPTVMAQEPGVYRVLAPPFTVVYQGIAFAKADTGLRDAVLGALQGLIADGAYGTLIAKWHLEASAAKAITLNGAALP